MPQFGIRGAFCGCHQCPLFLTPPWGANVEGMIALWRCCVKLELGQDESSEPDLDKSARGFRRQMMAYYLVHATLRERNARRVSGEVGGTRFCALATLWRGGDEGVGGGTWSDDGRVVWEEEDYCSPPLAMEHTAVLDRYFTGIEVETVREDGMGADCRVAALVE